MMFEAKELCRQAGIEEGRLEAWIEAGWVCPKRTRGGQFFSTMDFARVELILDLAGPMGVNDEGVAIILDLLDQIHGLRHALQSMTSVVAAQPLSVRQHIRSDAQRNARSRRTGSPPASAPAEGRVGTS
jgi:chaperone modulatory protein CbpM